MNKVYGGTTNEAVPSMCETCRSAAIVRGARSSDDRIFCRALNNSRAIPMVFVSECSIYDDKRQPSRWDMEQIAWVLTTSPNRKVGFVSPLENERIQRMPKSEPPR